MIERRSDNMCLLRVKGGRGKTQLHYCALDEFFFFRFFLEAVSNYMKLDLIKGFEFDKELKRL